MCSVAGKVITTLTAPYGVSLSAAQLAEKIVNPKSADEYDVSVFSFLSDVSVKLQNEFIEQMGINKASVAKVATRFSKMAGYKLALATE